MKMPGHRRSFERIVREMWLLAAVLVVLWRLLLWGGIFSLLAWSYSVWGNPDTPLRFLLLPGLGSLAAAIFLLYLQNRLLGRIYRASHVGGRRLTSAHIKKPATP